MFQLTIYSILGYGTDRSLVSYFTDNIVFRALLHGGYYSFAAILVVILLTVFFKKFRLYFLSLVMALFALYLLILIVEVTEDLSLLPKNR